jgi:hypothetical protein
LIDEKDDSSEKARIFGLFCYPNVWEKLEKMNVDIGAFRPLAGFEPTQGQVFGSIKVKIQAPPLLSAKK